MGEGACNFVNDEILINMAVCAIVSNIHIRTNNNKIHTLPTCNVARSKYG